MEPQREKVFELSLESRIAKLSPIKIHRPNLSVTSARRDSRLTKKRFQMDHGIHVRGYSSKA